MKYYGLELLQIHLYTAISGEAYSLFFPRSKAAAYGCRQVIAHARGTAVADESRMLFYVYSMQACLHRPVTKHYCLIPGHPPADLVEKAVRICTGRCICRFCTGRCILIVFLRDYRIVAFPSLTDTKPLLMCLCRRPCSIAYGSIQLFEKVPAVCLYPHLHMDTGLYELIFIYIYHNDIGFSCPVLYIVAHLAAAEATPHREHQIGILYSPVAGSVTEETGYAYKELIVMRHKIRSIPCHSYGYPELSGDLAHERQTAPHMDSTAYIKDRPLRITYPLKYLAYGLFRHRFRIIIRTFSVALALIKLNKLIGVYISTLYIKRHIEPDRTRSAVSRKIYGFVYMIFYGLRLYDHLRVLGHMSDHRRDIVLLISHSSHGYPRRPCGGRVSDLSAHYEHGYRVKPCPQHTGKRIRTARSCGTAHKRHLLYRPEVSLRCYSRCLLMLYEDILKSLLMPEGYVQMHRSAARHRKIVSESSVYQILRYPIRYLNLHILTQIFPPDILSPHTLHPPLHPDIYAASGLCT